jgi:predicted nucleotidyltransferase
VTLEEVEPKLREVLARWGGLRFAFVFGSAVARGLQGARDLDIAVQTARPAALLEQARLARELEAVAGRTVDLVDLEAASTLLRWEVLTTGRVLLAPDEEALLEFRARTPIEWADLRPYLDREAAGLRRALGV